MHSEIGAKEAKTHKNMKNTKIRQILLIVNADQHFRFYTFSFNNFWGA